MTVTVTVTVNLFRQKRPVLTPTAGILSSPYIRACRPRSRRGGPLEGVSCPWVGPPAAQVSDVGSEEGPSEA